MFSLFERVKSGAGLMGIALQAFVTFPSLIVPLLVCWAVYAPVVIYQKYSLDWSAYSLGGRLGILFATILLFSVVISFSCLTLLTTVRQIETKGRPNVAVAVGVALFNTVRALPIAVLWAVIWFLLAVLEALFSRKREEDGAPEFSVEDVAKTLAGFDSWSFSGAFFRALQKGVRMLAFLIFPALLWEHDSTIQSIKRGLAVAHAHRVEFFTGFALTEFFSAIVFLPPLILFLLSGKLHIEFPDWVWIATIIYIGFAWSLSILMEQLFTAELYLWHLNWEKARKEAHRTGAKLPKLRDVKRPSLTDGIPDMA